MVKHVFMITMLCVSSFACGMQQPGLLEKYRTRNQEIKAYFKQLQITKLDSQDAVCVKEIVNDLEIRFSFSIERKDESWVKDNVERYLEEDCVRNKHESAKKYSDFARDILPSWAIASAFVGYVAKLSGTYDLPITVAMGCVLFLMPPTGDLIELRRNKQKSCIPRPVILKDVLKHAIENENKTYLGNLPNEMLCELQRYYLNNGKDNAEYKVICDTYLKN